MTAAEQLGLVSIDDYLNGELSSDVKHEYCGGYVYAMAGAKTLHNRIATTATASLAQRLRGKTCEAFNSDMKVRVQLPTHTRFYYPDAMVVCEPNGPDSSFQDRPVVIIEVVSDATRRIDEGEKREAYLNIATLSVYLIVDTDAPRVTVYRRTDTGFIAQAVTGLAGVVPLPTIGTELPLSELYERVDFAG